MSKQHMYMVAVLVFAVGMIGGRMLSDTFFKSDSALPTPVATAEAAGGITTQRTRRPDFSLPDMQDKTHHVNEWDGKVLVVNFWATWCAPCRTEIPFFNTLQEKYADRGVQFIGVALDDKKAVERFMKIIPIDYPVLVGDDSAIPIAKSYGNLEGVLPYTVFVDRKGMIASIAQGGLSEEVTEKTLQKLF